MPALDIDLIDVSRTGLDLFATSLRPDGRAGLELTVGKGWFVILSATGDYAGLKGQGAAEVGLFMVLPPSEPPEFVLVAEYNGRAHIAP